MDDNGCTFPSHQQCHPKLIPNCVDSSSHERPSYFRYFIDMIQSHVTSCSLGILQRILTEPSLKHIQMMVVKVDSKIVSIKMLRVVAVVEPGFLIDKYVERAHIF